MATDKIVLGLSIKTNELIDMTSENIERLKSHDSNTFRLFVDDYKKPLYFFLIKMLKDHDKTHDVLQDVFIRVYEKVHTFKGNASFKTWVYRIASNLALNELDKEKRKRTDSLEEKSHLEKVGNASVETELCKENLHSAIEKSLSFLTPTQEMVFRLRHLNGKSTKEASELMNCSEGNIKKQLFLAVSHVRAFLKTHYPDTNWG